MFTVPSVESPKPGHTTSDNDTGRRRKPGKWHIYEAFYPNVMHCLKLRVHSEGTLVQMSKI